ncbi:hypothetical protein GGR21_003210 [Dysgonomonas hofstadii]|uniref:Uncharacterized protein n=1 Tax=Dysgonomonas hofstadii TaxID=637886 RepID=A0A840CZA2_9BACT|nr:hypothetical protein [Dysgonomonas hofstadii]
MVMFVHYIYNEIKLFHEIKNCGMLKRLHYLSENKFSDKFITFPLILTFYSNSQFL